MYVKKHQIHVKNPGMSFAQNKNKSNVKNHPGNKSNVKNQSGFGVLGYWGGIGVWGEIN